jgi:hypothetical protein
MRVCGCLIVLSCLSTQAVLPPAARAGEGHAHEHEHAPTSAPAHDHAHAHGFELGLSAGLVYVPKEQELAASAHVHVVVAIPGTIAALGLGYERLFDEHAHNTISVVLHCRVTERVSLTLSPGLTFDDDDPGDLAFTMHIEPTYDLLVWKTLHMGPSLGAAADSGGLHLTAGVHVGLGF